MPKTKAGKPPAAATALERFAKPDGSSERPLDERNGHDDPKLTSSDGDDGLAAATVAR